jgi:hypothetical protein
MVLLKILNSTFVVTGFLIVHYGLVCEPLMTTFCSDLPESHCHWTEKDDLLGNTSSDNVVNYRCAKCDARKKEERMKFAQTILANVAQFLQGIITMANSGKDANDKIKAEQCVLMAQAVGNIIYEAQEYDRSYSLEWDVIEKSASSIQRRSAFMESLYNYLRYVMDDKLVLISLADCEQTHSLAMA